jgi:hypothetical protein
MSDKYNSFQKGVESPTTKAFDITPNDSADLPDVVRAIHVGVAGTVKITGIENTTATYRCFAGQKIVGFIKKVHVTGTSASELVGEV